MRRDPHCAGCYERIWLYVYGWSGRDKYELFFHRRCKAAFMEGINAPYSVATVLRRPRCRGGEVDE
jgi:hypothetical protein